MKIAGIFLLFASVTTSFAGLNDSNLQSQQTSKDKTVAATNVVVDTKTLSTALQPGSDGSSLTGVTKSSVVPSTPPSPAQILIGISGGGSYAPASVSGDGTLDPTGALTVTKSGGIAFGSAAFQPASAFAPAGGGPGVSSTFGNMSGAYRTGSASAASKPVPVSSDFIPLWDSITGGLRRLTWSNLVAAITGLFAPVATSGAYADLTGKPTIPAAQVNSDWTAGSGVAQVLNKPTFGTASGKDVPVSGNASGTQVVLGSDGRLTDSRPASDVFAWAKASIMPLSSTSTVGGVQVDGNTIGITAGVISVVSFTGGIDGGGPASRFLAAQNISGGGPSTTFTVGQHISGGIPSSTF